MANDNYTPIIFSSKLIWIDWSLPKIGRDFRKKIASKMKKKSKSVANKSSSPNFIVFNVGGKTIQKRMRFPTVLFGTLQ